MVKHIVLWRLKDEALGRRKIENAHEIKRRVEALKDKISIIRRLEVGINFEPSESAADVVLYAEFDNREALAAYQDHPEHTALKDFILAVRSERRIVDYEV